MDVLTPTLIWAEEGCYRFYETHAWPSEDVDIPIASVPDSKLREFVDLDDEPSSEGSNGSMGCRPCKQETPSIDMDVTLIERDACESKTSVKDDVVHIKRDDCKQETSPNIDVIPIGKNKYQHTFHVDKVFFPRIVGPKGSTLLQLQFDTDTSIKVPQRDACCSNIVITGSMRDKVVLARHQVDLLLKNSNRRDVYTHFLSIPLTDKTIMANYTQFKTTVLNETGKNSRGVCEKLFKKPEKLHLCIGMLVLTNDEEIKMAIRTLQECNEQVIKPIIQKEGPVIIEAKGLFVSVPIVDTMVNALYCRVSSNNNMLQELAEKTLKFFVVKGLIKKPREGLRMRMALINVAFNKDLRKPDGQAPGKFYPKDILKNHSGYFFGKTVLKSIHLSQRGSYDPDGYYATVSKISLVD